MEFMNCIAWPVDIWRDLGRGIRPKMDFIQLAEANLMSTEFLFIP